MPAKLAISKKRGKYYLVLHVPLFVFSKVLHTSFANYLPHIRVAFDFALEQHDIPIVERSHFRARCATPNSPTRATRP